MTETRENGLFTLTNLIEPNNLRFITVIRDLGLQKDMKMRLNLRSLLVSNKIREVLQKFRYMLYRGFRVLTPLIQRI